ncbi:hypothetical protein MJ1_0625 [Nanobdella aerobiophila]|uniref:Uncharacterized protein n=2 Tax=Nanobdella aerobiophila TaxID=2586965 RepID=A0A915SAH7_9ARCH|nr:hypothetical protein MJ1_0625 [Nanobdella aerobiophila]
MSMSIGLLIPFLLLASTMYITTSSLVNNIQNMDSGIIAYANCAQNMMNYAFIGQVYNYTACYEQEINQTQLNCSYNSTDVICNLNGTTYLYPLK